MKSTHQTMVEETVSVPAYAAKSNDMVFIICVSIRLMKFSSQLVTSLVVSAACYEEKLEVRTIGSFGYAF
ncbi:hypothetical protein RRG08_064909 [Elysia crispata]|uniref:Uncharacterized protein n=1 Tax=Elysia crispata TaxID=231223 RepID=A0AAE1CLG4_9GAST|nr:hypothetical protein RRG08_064909 [Elysia crispata]